MVQRTLTRERSAAAYKLVDLSSLHKTTRKDILEDALAGGGLYGIRVVEEHVNGAARAPVYGVYNDGPDADKWATAKQELDIDGAAVEIHDPKREGALRGAAQGKAAAEATRVRKKEAEAVGAIVGDGDDADESDFIVRNPSSDRGEPEDPVEESDEADDKAEEAEEPAEEPVEKAASPKLRGRGNKSPR